MRRGLDLESPRRARARSTRAAKSGKAGGMLVESAREKRIQRARLDVFGAAMMLAAVVGLVGCGASQAERSGSRAPGGGATAERATGASLEEGKASYYSDKLAGRPTAH